MVCVLVKVVAEFALATPESPEPSPMKCAALTVPSCAMLTIGDSEFASVPCINVSLVGGGPGHGPSQTKNCEVVCQRKKSLSAVAPSNTELTRSSNADGE